MIDPNVDLAEYKAADKRKKFLQHQLSKQKSIDIAYLFIHLVLNDNYIKENFGINKRFIIKKKFPDFTSRAETKFY